MTITRDVFASMLLENKTVYIFYFTATWCKPCQSIKDYLSKKVPTLDNIHFVVVDIDVHFDVYSYLRTKKQIVGVPSFLAYKAGNTSFASDLYISGTNIAQLDCFFEECMSWIE
mgnify:CR=1 FL=1